MKGVTSLPMTCTIVISEEGSETSMEFTFRPPLNTADPPNGVTEIVTRIMEALNDKQVTSCEVDGVPLMPNKSYDNIN